MQHNGFAPIEACFFLKARNNLTRYRHMEALIYPLSYLPVGLRPSLSRPFFLPQRIFYARKQRVLGFIGKECVGGMPRHGNTSSQLAHQSSGRTTLQVIKTRVQRTTKRQLARSSLMRGLQCGYDTRHVCETPIQPIKRQ